MEKLPVKKVTSLVESLKGKKPLVIAISAVVFILGIFAVKKGYISEDLLNPDLIVSYVNSAFGSTSVDSVSNHVIDSIPAIDSLAH